jgi:hypothetical protein
VATVNSAANRMGFLKVAIMRTPFGWGFSALRHPTAENFRKGGVHEVGTVVFTASAQFRRASNTHVGSDKRYYKLPSAWRSWPCRLQVNVLPFAQTELQLTDNGAPPRCVACQVQGPACESE